MTHTIYILAFLVTTCLLALQQVDMVASMTVTSPKQKKTSTVDFLANINVKVNGEEASDFNNSNPRLVCNSNCNGSDIANRLTAVEETLKEVAKALLSLTRTPSSCKEALNTGASKSGVYTIDPRDGQGPFQVYCDMVTDGGGWTVFQRRRDGSVDFFRGWNDYKNGFGDLNGEFWLGLDKIHRLARIPRLLRVDMIAFSGETAHALFKTFKIGGEAQQYVLNIDGYSGNVGDSLGGHNGAKFHTKDKDTVNKCANQFKGAWWYIACHSSNLNGLYHKGAHKSYADGVNWKTWKGYQESLKFTEMKVRPY